MWHHSEHSPYRLLIALLCCIVLFAGSSGISLGKSRQIPAANFSLWPYDPLHGVTKPYFVINARPGERLQEQMYIANTGDAAGVARLTPVDATTAQAGGAIYLSPDQVQHNVGTWITLNVQQVTLASKEKKILQFLVTIPKDVRSGQHFAGIAAQDMTLQRVINTTGKSNFQTIIRRITVITIEVVVPGPQITQLVAKGIQIGGVNSYQTLLINLQNIGNIMIACTGSLQVINARGMQLQPLPIYIDTFLPQTSITFPVNIKGRAIGVGTYRAMLTLNYGHGHVLDYTTTFTVTQQQIERTFGIPPPRLQTPWDAISRLSWIIILIALVVGIVLFAGGQKVSGLIIRRHKKAQSLYKQKKVTSRKRKKVA